MLYACNSSIVLVTKVYLVNNASSSVTVLAIVKDLYFEKVNVDFAAGNFKEPKARETAERSRKNEHKEVSREKISQLFHFFR